MKLKQDIMKVVSQLKIKEHIKLVILFGSRARGDYNENSDIDIAILLDKKLADSSNNLELRSELIGFFSSALGEECDIVLLNQALPLLKYQIIKYGKLLFCSDDFSYHSFFSSVLKEYFDFKYYLDYHNKMMLNRIKEGGEE